MARLKLWNWQKDDWPDFRFDAGSLTALEERFLQESGVYWGAVKHLEKDAKDFLAVELMSEEALKTSEIEGEILNRESVQSSIRRQFGLATDHRQVPPAEQGISELMVELYRESQAPLDEARLLHWHALLMNGRRDLIGGVVGKIPCRGPGQASVDRALGGDPPQPEGLLRNAGMQQQAQRDHGVVGLFCRNRLGIPGGIPALGGVSHRKNKVDRAPARKME